MKESLATLLGQLKAAPATTKAAIGAVVAGVVVATLAALHFAGQPHYAVLMSGLDDAETARVGEALAGAGVDWRSSQPPGPFVVYVDQSELTAARNAVFAAGALRPTSGGILTETGGLSTLLLGSQEREQIMRKRVWEEMERMLELQDFIVDAKVQTLVPEARVFGRQPELSASVTLVTRGGLELTRSQARTVARLVRFGLGVDEENLVIADDSGESVFDGADVADGSMAADDWLDAVEDADRRLEAKASHVLDEILGPGLARVSVKSDWDFTRSRTIADTSGPDGQLVSERKSSSSDPRFADTRAGGVAGVGSNVDPTEFGVESQGVVDARSGVAPPSAEPAIAKRSEEDRVYAPSRTLRATEQRTPTLERLSVALFLDDGVPAQSAAALENAVKATVGFSVERGDSFELAQVHFAERGGSAGEAAPPPAEMSPLVTTLLERGLEIVLAIVFFFFLLKTFRGASKARKQREAEILAAREHELEARAEEARRRAEALEHAAEQERAAEDDPVVRSRRRVSDLVDEEPEKVADLLTAWVRDARRVAAN